MKRETCERKLDCLVRQIAKVAKKIDILTRIVTDGADQEYPWYRLKPARMKQVEAVRECLREHKSYTIRHAAARAYVPAPGGYPTWEALATYCYKVNLPMYV